METLAERLGPIPAVASSLTALDEAATAVRNPARAASPRGARLGELLVSAGLLTFTQLQLLLQEQTRTGQRLGEIILDDGLVPAPTLVRILAEQCQLELEEEGGFGSGLRAAIESRHRAGVDAEVLPSDQAAVASPERKSRRERAAQPGEPATEERDQGRRALGELLLARGLLTSGELEEALAEQGWSGRLLGEIVVDRGFITMPELVEALAEQLDADSRPRSAFGRGFATH